MTSTRPTWHVVVNGGAGAKALAPVHDVLIRTAAVRGRRLCFYPSTDARRLTDAAGAAAEAARADGGIVVAVGGDGTLSTVAAKALAHGTPMGVVPHGTFNYFAREHGLPLDPGDAVPSLDRGAERLVQVGWAGARPFLVNASLGTHPDLLEDRERDSGRFGRHRATAVVSGLVHALQRSRRLRLELHQDGCVRDVSASTLFISNCRAQLAPLALAHPADVDHGRLVAVAVPPLRPMRVLQMAWHAAIGRLAAAGDLLCLAMSRMVVQPKWFPARRIKLALDGEVHAVNGPIEFRAGPAALRVVGAWSDDG